MPRNYVGLDFETYGAEDLPTHGLDRYVSHKTFQPLIASATVEGFPTTRFNFVENHQGTEVERLRQLIGGSFIVAHNAPFEQAVLKWLGLDYPSERFIDSAVIARAAGAGGRLEAAAPQLLGVDKMAQGRNLIKLFSIPGRYQEDSGSPMFDLQVVEDHTSEWLEFHDYCDLDAELGLQLALSYDGYLTAEELKFQAITMDMNRTGWCVDVPLVEEMQRRYLENLVVAEQEFRTNTGADDLNLGSLKQLKEWCADRGIKAVSFDEKHTARLLEAVRKKTAAMAEDDPKLEGYLQVEEMLYTKQVLGGSSLKKLQVILDTAKDEGDGTYRLRDQYIHCGAGQSLRTTGRSTQMQNLKQIGENPDDMSELYDLAVEWDNDQLARNIRQVFTASHPQGRLLVGDFKAVESRGLAYLARAEWKLEAYRQGKDMYKVLATKFFPGLAYDAVTKPQRKAGKVGELACGYGAAGGAVQSFAEGMGMELTEAEAGQIVRDWRLANPEATELWTLLNEMLHEVVKHTQTQTHQLPDGLVLRFTSVATPVSLVKQHPGAKTVAMTVYAGGRPFMKRYFQGCYVRGGNIGYYKPSERKTGDLWKNHFVDPKTKQVRFYELYGGKLAGILTQSFCRELFFRCLVNVHRWVQQHPEQLMLVGQFHDEIAVDWRPGQLSLEDAKAKFEELMSDPGSCRSFPLAADIKDDYRYTK